jgi:alpha-1,6-mannosyltransferase
VRRRQLFLLYACGFLLLVLTGAGLYAQREYGIDGFVAVALMQGAVYALTARLVWRGAGSRHTVATIIGVAVAMRIAVVLAPPYLSSDIYRYVWDGRVIAAGINPYEYVPNDPHLASLHDAEIFPEINRGNYARTIYPPAAQAIFFLVTRFGESLTVMKLAMVGFEAIAVALMLRLLAGSGHPAAWIAVYLWHPLPLWEFAGSGHIDAAMVAFVALALWSRRPLPTGLALAGGVLVKLYPAVLLPAVWRRWDWRMPVLFCVAIVAAYLPFAGAGAHVFGFLPNYASEEGFAGGAGFYWWNLAKSVLPLGGVSNLPYIAAAACLLAALAIRVAFRDRGPDADTADRGGAALLAAAFTVLLTPHYPWYFSWLVVFACLAASPALVWLTAASFLLYLLPVWPFPVWNDRRLLVESIIYMPFLILAARELWRRSLREPASDDEPDAR